MAVYGYVRVSTADQNPERQIEKMRSLGVDAIFVDKASGKDLDRPEYRRMMGAVRAGDAVLLDSLDRLGRNYDQVTVEWKRLTRGEGVDVAVLDLDFFDSRKFREMGDLGKVMEDMLLSMLAYVAQAERDKMRARQAEGIRIARAEGKYKGGVKKRIPEERMCEAQKALSGGASKAAVARMLGVSRGTVSNMIEDGRLVA